MTHTTSQCSGVIILTLALLCSVPPLLTPDAPPDSCMCMRWVFVGQPVHGSEGRGEAVWHARTWHVEGLAGRGICYSHHGCLPLLLLP